MIDDSEVLNYIGRIDLYKKQCDILSDNIVKSLSNIKYAYLTKNQSTINDFVEILKDNVFYFSKKNENITNCLNNNVSKYKETVNKVENIFNNMRHL